MFSERTSVLILGGGMAGVAAAHTLHAAGMHDFLLLEATGRLGGRVRDKSFCGKDLSDKNHKFIILQSIS